jgi:hypothetical protein
VELTRELANLALRRIATLCEQKGLDPGVYKTYYWGSEAEYFSPWVDPSGQPGEIKAACSEVEEFLEKLQVGKRDMVVVADKVAILQTQIASVECGQMVVREDGISFTAIPKHTDFYVTTTEIPKEFLQQAVTSVII